MRSYSATKTAVIAYGNAVRRWLTPPIWNTHPDQMAKNSLQTAKEIGNIRIA